MDDLLKKEAERIGPHLEKSKIFMPLFSENYKKDPRTVLQLGIAIIMDKPIALVALEGVTVSEHLKKIAFCIEYIKKDDKKSIEEAAKRIGEAVKKREKV